MEKGPRGDGQIILGCSKNRSSSLSFSKVGSSEPGLASSCSPSSSELSPDEPNGFAFSAPMIPGPPGAAKLVSPPPGLGAAAANPLNPDPRVPKAEVLEVAAAANGEGPAAAANPVVAGFSDSVVEVLLKTDDVDAPREPKGDCVEDANAPKVDEANAEAEVT